MTDSAFRYTGRVMLIQIGIGLAAFGATAVLAPLSLLFDVGLWGSVVTALVKVAVAALSVSAVITAVRLRSHRFALRALSLQSTSIDASDLRALDALPAVTTLTFFVVSALASFLIALPDVRPAALDDGRTASLVVLAITILSAAAIPHYVLVRRATLRLVELSPIEATTALLQERGLKVTPRIRQRILLSVAAPVMLVGAGAVLLAHAHLRTFLEESRKTTAVVLARAVLDSQPAALGAAADQDTIRAARELGFAASLSHETPPELVAAHAAGVIHRDLKPGNIFLEQTGAPQRPERAKILDFGISKLARPGKEEPTLTAFDATLGSFAYMAPEQVKGAARADERADIYAVGAVTFRALAGRLPFEGTTAALLVSMKLNRAAPSLAEVTGEKWPAGVERFLERALAQRREDRFGSAGEALTSWRAIQPENITRARRTSQRARPTDPPPAPEDPATVVDGPPEMTIEGTFADGMVLREESAGGRRRGSR